jgi:hypothetical protein
VLGVRLVHGGRVGATRGELLPDHAEGQELVALEPEDRPEPAHVRRRVEAITALGAARREQLLVLEVPDLRDRDVRELGLEQLADRTDRERLPPPWEGLRVRPELRGGRRRERGRFGRVHR